MRDEIERALAPLVGLPLSAADREADLLRLRFGAAGELALHVACPWRLRDAERVLVGSGDLLTPADPEEEPATFDWEAPGASWLDVRLAELQAADAARPPAVEAVEADVLGGVRLFITGGRLLELFPNATPTGHVSTEFWRLVRADGGEPDFAVGTFGAARGADG